MKELVEKLIQEQISEWSLATQNFAALGNVISKELEVEGITYRAQFNPARITSSAAKVDTKSIQERKCFLCSANRPKEQKGIRHGEYEILINPFPIFPRHLTIPDISHVDQKISGRVSDMLELAETLSDYVIFYNGPKCGASAPDHMHFQAGNKGFLGIEKDVDGLEKELIFSHESASVYLLNDSPRNAVVFQSNNISDIDEAFNSVYELLPLNEDDIEPMMNILAWFTKDTWTMVVLPRVKHRPSCFFAEGVDKMTISPASVDLGGVFITPIEADFNRINGNTIKQILSEVSMPRTKILELLTPLKTSL